MESMSTVCNTHPNQSLKFYCPDHRIWVCEQCVIAHSKCTSPLHYSEITLEGKQPSNENYEHSIDILNALSSDLNEAASDVEDQITNLEEFNRHNVRLECTLEKDTVSEAMQYTTSKQSSDNKIVGKIEYIKKKMVEQVACAQFKMGELWNCACCTSMICAISDFTMINEWIGQKSKFKEIFSTRKHGYSAATFHYNCTGITPTIVIAKTSFGKIIGGYSTLAWRKGSSDFDYVQDPALKCFLFSITLKKQYKLKDPEFAICNSNVNGPKFGGGHDLEIVNDCNVAKNHYFNIGHSYESENAGKYYGGESFFITDYEVYQVLK